MFLLPLQPLPGAPAVVPSSSSGLLDIGTGFRNMLQSAQQHLDANGTPTPPLSEQKPMLAALMADLLDGGTPNSGDTPKQIITALVPEVPLEGDLDSAPTGSVLPEQEETDLPLVLLDEGEELGGAFKQVDGPLAASQTSQRSQGSQVSQKLQVPQETQAFQASQNPQPSQGFQESQNVHKVVVSKDSLPVDTSAKEAFVVAEGGSEKQPLSFGEALKKDLHQRGFREGVPVQKATPTTLFASEDLGDPLPVFRHSKGAQPSTLVEVMDTEGEVIPTPYISGAPLSKQEPESKMVQEAEGSQEGLSEETVVLKDGQATQSLSDSAPLIVSGTEQDLDTENQVARGDVSQTKEPFVSEQNKGLQTGGDTSDSVTQHVYSGSVAQTVYGEKQGPYTDEVASEGDGFIPVAAKPIPELQREVNQKVAGRRSEGHMTGSTSELQHEVNPQVVDVQASAKYTADSDTEEQTHGASSQIARGNGARPQDVSSSVLGAEVSGRREQPQDKTIGVSDAPTRVYSTTHSEPERVEKEGGVVPQTDQKSVNVTSVSDENASRERGLQPSQLSQTENATKRVDVNPSSQLQTDTPPQVVAQGGGLQPERDTIQTREPADSARAKVAPQIGGAQNKETQAPPGPVDIQTDQNRFDNKVAQRDVSDVNIEPENPLRAAHSETLSHTENQVSSSNPLRQETASVTQPYSAKSEDRVPYGTPSVIKNDTAKGSGELPQYNEDINRTQKTGESHTSTQQVVDRSRPAVQDPVVDRSRPAVQDPVVDRSRPAVQDPVVDRSQTMTTPVSSQGLEENAVKQTTVSQRSEFAQQVVQREPISETVVPAPSIAQVQKDVAVVSQQVVEDVAPRMVDKPVQDVSVTRSESQILVSSDTQTGQNLSQEQHRSSRQSFVAPTASSTPPPEQHVAFDGGDVSEGAPVNLEKPVELETQGIDRIPGRAEMRVDMPSRVVSTTDIPDRQLDTMPSEEIDRNYRVSEQVIRNARVLTRGGATEVTMRLDPQALGEVTIRLSTQDKVMSGEISVENQKVQEIVQRNLGALRESLAGQGIQIENIDVTVQDRGAQADRETFRENLEERSSRRDQREQSQSDSRWEEADRQQKQKQKPEGQVDFMA